MYFIVRLRNCSSSVCRTEMGKIDSGARIFPIFFARGARLKLGMVSDAAKAVEEVYQADWGRIVATLIGQVGDFDLAEEAAQEAFAAAVDQWRVDGVPAFPRA